MGIQKSKVPPFLSADAHIEDAIAQTGDAITNG